MTFQEALISLRDPNGNASPEGLALAEQVEANRVAIEKLHWLYKKLRCDSAHKPGDPKRALPSEAK